VSEVKFNSIQFLAFFPVVAIMFFLLPHRWRWVLLLGASYFFYMRWTPEYIIVLLMVTAIGYLAGLWLSRETRLAARRLLVILSLTGILGILFFFKDSDLSNRVLRTVLDQFGARDLFSGIHLVLPLGISFFTFQTMSYIIDVYRGVGQPEKHAGIYALFIAFFPHLTAGPIARTNLLLPQFYESHSPDYEKIVTGLQRMAWGFFKKLVIADRLALLVNRVYGEPTSYSGLFLILATYAFAFQIYCDFSGYADIAIGAARVMGFQLQENFQQPYFAQSIVDFWRRWHITLYNWLRDYIFYPTTRALSRSRVSFRSSLVLIVPPMVTMLASGLWHGNGWTVLIWGALHGLYLVISVVWSRWHSGLQQSFMLPSGMLTGLKIFATFNLVCFAWIFFRAQSFSDAVYIVGHLFVKPGTPVALFDIVPGGWYEWMIALSALLMMEVVDWMRERNGSLQTLIRRQPVWLRWSAYYGLVMVIFMFGKFEASQFIYSRF
jgi:D-alanyl-lipoteichoic acid acyltransferase DltB (MBOAT superfamily)